MELLSFYVDGFENLSKVKIGLTGITALVALNSYGKSNVLRAIDFGLAFINAPRREIKTFFMAAKEFIPLHQAMFARNFHFAVEFSLQMGEKTYIALYGYEFVWARDENTEPRVIAEYLRYRAESAKRFTTLIKREEAKAYYRAYPQGRCANPIAVTGAELVVNQLENRPNLFYKPILQAINQMALKIDFGLWSRESLEVKQSDLSIAKDSASDLAEFIFKLKKQQPQRFALLLEAQQKLFPEIESISAHRFDIGAEADEGPNQERIHNYFFYLTAKLSNLTTSINFSNLSAGTQRVFKILSRIILANLNDVILVGVEEPENNVHPKLLLSYLRIINSLRGSSKILITSHSPFITSCLGPEELYVGTSREPGIAQFSGFKREKGKGWILAEDAAECEMSTGEYIFSMLADDEALWEPYLEAP